MNLLIFLLVSTIRIFLTIEQLLFLVRAVLSWIFIGDENAITNFLYAITEPLILPARVILNKFESVQNIPIDIPFIVTVMLMTVLQLLLPTVYI